MPASWLAEIDNVAKTWPEALDTELQARASPTPSAYDAFATKANGTPVTTDSGHTWTHSGDALSIISGKLTNADVTGATGGYAVLDLGSPITHIGATFTLGAHSTNTGAAGIVVWQRAMGGAIPNSPLHLTIGYASMTVSYWIEGAGSPVTLGSVTFNADLVVDREYTVDAYIRGTTIQITLSNGATLTATDAHVATFAGAFACWEVYAMAANTDAKAKFVEVWADTATPAATAARSRDLTKYDVTVMAPKAIAKTYAAGSSTPLAIGTGSTAFDASLYITTVYPASGQIYVSIEYFAVNVGAAAILQYIKGEFIQISTTAGSAYINAGKVMSGAPGAADTFTFAGIRFGGTSFTVQQDAASGFLVTTRAIPL